MAKGKKSGKKKDKIKAYYSNRHEYNMERKRERHQKRVEYFKARAAKYSVLVPREVTQFLSPSVISKFNSNVDKNNSAELIEKLAYALIEESSVSLPKGRVKKELRKQLLNR